MKVKKIIMVLLAVLMVVVSLVGCQGTEKETAPSQTTSQTSSQTETKNEGLQKNFKFASMSVGGSWYIYGVTIADLMKEAIPGSVTDVLPYQGGIGNPLLVGSGDADLGLSFSSAQNWAYNGLADYEGQPITNLRALLGGLSRPYRIGVMIREDLGIKSIQDIIDKKMKVRLITVQPGGLGETMARQVLESYGISYEDIKKYGGTVNNVDLSVAVSQLKDGQADIFIHNVSFQQPDITEMCLRGGITFLPIGDKEREYLSKTYGHVNNVNVEAGEFVGVKEDTVTIGYPTGIVVSDKMSDETAYAIVKAICENTDKLAAAHASLKSFDPSKAGDEALNGFIPLHPGAEKYYKEMGYIK